MRKIIQIHIIFSSLFILALTLALQSCGNKTDDSNADPQPIEVDDSPYTNDQAGDNPNTSLKNTSRVIAQPGDVALGVDEEITGARPVGLSDDGSVLLIAEYADGKTALVRSKVSDGSLEAIAVNDYELSSWATVLLPRSFSDASMVIFTVGERGETFQVQGTQQGNTLQAGIYYWRAETGIKPILQKEAACSIANNIGSLSVKINAIGDVLVHGYVMCSSRSSPLLIGQPDNIKSIDLIGRKIDACSTISNYSEPILQEDGSVVLELHISRAYVQGCMGGAERRLATIDQNNNLSFILSDRQTVSAADPSSFRSTLNHGVDAFGRVTAWIKMYDEANSGFSSHKPIAISNGKSWDYILSATNNGDSIGLTYAISSLSTTAEIIDVAPGGRVLIDLPVIDGSQNKKNTLWYYENDELNLLIEPGTMAPGYKNKTIGNYYNYLFSPEGRVAFTTSIDDENALFVEDLCEDQLFRFVNKNVFSSLPDQRYPDNSIRLLGLGLHKGEWGLNNRGDLIAAFRKSVVLFHVPKGTCDQTIKINTTSDLPDTNPNDDECSTGVTNAQGDKECSLRAAIEESNARKYGAATVEFDFENVSGDILISPQTELPIIKKRFILKHTPKEGQDIILTGVNAGESHGLYATTSSTVSLSGFKITKFKRDGIFTDSGGPLFIENMSITDNGWYGVEAGGPIEIIGTINKQAVISGNGYAGVRAENGHFTRSTIKFADIYDNGGAGIHSDGQMTLIATRIFDNGAEGFVSTEVGNCEARILTTKLPAFDLGATITTSSFTNNGGYGIFIDTGSLSLQPGTEISNNADSGIVLDCGSLVSGKIVVANESKTKITGNGGSSNCFRTENEKTISYICNGGGIELRGETALVSHLDDMQISNNQGFGLFNTTETRISSVDINDNNGPGIISDWTDERGLVGNDFLLRIAGNLTKINNNKAEGIKIDIGNILITGDSSIENNSGTGISISEGNLEIAHDLFRSSTLIQSNGSAGNCSSWQYNEDTGKLSKSIQPCTKGGILISEGNLDSVNLNLKNNTEFGLDVTGDVKLFIGQVCNNGNDMVVSGSLNQKQIGTCN